MTRIAIKIRYISRIRKIVFIMRMIWITLSEKSAQIQRDIVGEINRYGAVCFNVLQLPG